MIIVLEGPDGGGKTTLAKQLMTRYNLEYHHEGPPPAGKPALQHYGAILESWRGGNVVLDRFALGERVYGPLFRNADGIGADGWVLFLRLARAVGAVQVMCLPSYATCHRAWCSGRKEMFTQSDDLRNIYNSFRGFTSTQDVIFDYEAPFAFGELCKVLDQPRPTLPLGVIGTPGARFLFVGDRPNGECPLPFFSTVGSSSSLYLNSAIELAGFGELEIMFTNVFRTQDGTEPSNLRLGQQVTIALGTVATDACYKQGISSNFRSVRHPQYWRRFYHHDIAAYARQLQVARELESYRVSER